MAGKDLLINFKGQDGELPFRN